jgi:hypothetical protein
MIDTTTGPFNLVPKEIAKAALEGSIMDVKEAGGFTAGAGGECGMGRVLIQLLSILSIDDPQLVGVVLRESEALASPTLTVILDLPWPDTALSGWPFFGILSQVALHKSTVMENAGAAVAEVDGLVDQASQEYFAHITEAKKVNDVSAMIMASMMFIQGEPNGQSPLGLLTALAAQTAAQEKVADRLGFMQGLQAQLRGFLPSATDLEASLSTRWPLWGLLHVAVDAFYGAA